MFVQILSAAGQDPQLAKSNQSNQAITWAIPIDR
jgi:hypothetical protein